MWTTGPLIGPWSKKDWAVAQSVGPPCPQLREDALSTQIFSSYYTPAGRLWAIDLAACQFLLASRQKSGGSASCPSIGRGLKKVRPWPNALDRRICLLPLRMAPPALSSVEGGGVKGVWVRSTTAGRPPYFGRSALRRPRCSEGAGDLPQPRGGVMCGLVATNLGYTFRLRMESSPQVLGSANTRAHVVPFG